jgi:hypothetical protein
MMTTLLLAFANNPESPLLTLQQEDAELSRLLTPGAMAGHYQIHRESFATVEKLSEYILKFKDSLALFLFSGHADRDRLFMADAVAHADGLAKLLGQCPKLQLVFLNGCSTEGQVAELLAQGVKVVVATDAPVNDRKASVFSIRFFDALQQKRSLKTAFDMARAAIDTEFLGVPFHTGHRGAGFAQERRAMGTWGLFYKDENEIALNWSLPSAPPVQTVENVNFTPNEVLVETLFTALGEYKDEIKKQIKQAENGMEVTLPEKRMAVLNALPAPLSEPIRKLLVPMDAQLGYDKVSSARLGQISEAYTTCMELMAFTMLAQLWEAFYAKGQQNLQIPEDVKAKIKSFFSLSKPERQVYDFLELVQKIKKVFDQNKISYFVNELADLSSLFEEDQQFAHSLATLNGLRLIVNQNASLNSDQLAYHCEHGEESLTYLYSKLGFMARYRLATIKSIEVQKYRHKREPGYDHSAVVLHNLLGGFAVTHVKINRPLDNLSVLLLNEETWEYLNLSPFVLDENAFFDKTDVGKILFYEYYDKAADIWSFRNVKSPNDPPLYVSKQKYPLVKEQFDAFAQLVFHQTTMKAI